MHISRDLEKKLQKLKQQLDARPQKRFHLKELNNTDFVDQYFANAFRHYFGESIYRYQLKSAMSYACTLLQQGTSVKVAAISTGYESVNSFSRAYKKYYGVAPSHHLNCTDKSQQLNAKMDK